MPQSEEVFAEEIQIWFPNIFPHLIHFQLGRDSCLHKPAESFKIMIQVGLERLIRLEVNPKF